MSVLVLRQIMVSILHGSPVSLRLWFRMGLRPSSIRSPSQTSVDFLVFSLPVLLMFTHEGTYQTPGFSGCEKKLPLLFLCPLAADPGPSDPVSRNPSYSSPPPDRSRSLTQEVSSLAPSGTVHPGMTAADCCGRHVTRVTLTASGRVDRHMC